MGFKVGIIGCGGISRCHADGYKENGAEVVAVTDMSAEAAAKLAEETGAAVFADYRALLASGVDTVSICTPPVAHEEVAIAALAAGVHVLCEKRRRAGAWRRRRPGRRHYSCPPSGTASCPPTWLSAS